MSDERYFLRGRRAFDRCDHRERRPAAFRRCRIRKSSRRSNPNRARFGRALHRWNVATAFYREGAQLGRAPLAAPGGALSRRMPAHTIFMISRATVNALRAPASPVVSFSKLMAALISGRPIPVVSITCLTALRRRLLLLLMLAT